MRRLICFFVSIVFLFNLTSCSKDKYDCRQKEYHEGFESIEKYVMEDYSDYINFDEPIFDDNNMTAVFNINFLRPYIRDDNEMASQNPYELIESVRERFNDYMNKDEGIYLRDYRIEIVFNKPNESRWATNDYYSQPVVILSNYSLHSANHPDRDVLYPYIECVEFLFLGSWQTEYSLDWVFLDGKTDISELYMVNDYSVDDIVSVIERLPELEYVVVGNANIEELSELFPDIQFV